MSTVVRCEKCGARYQVGPQLAGKNVKCKCGASVAVPKGDSAPNAATASDAKKPRPAPAAATADPYGFGGDAGGAGGDAFGLGGGSPSDPLGGLSSADPLAGGASDPLAGGPTADPLGALPTSSAGDPLAGGLPGAPAIGGARPALGAKPGAGASAATPSDGLWVAKPIVWGPAAGVGFLVLAFAIYVLNSSPKPPANPSIDAGVINPMSAGPTRVAQASPEATAPAVEPTNEATSSSTAEATTAATSEATPTTLGTAETPLPATPSTPAVSEGTPPNAPASGPTGLAGSNPPSNVAPGGDAPPASGPSSGASPSDGSAVHNEPQAADDYRAAMRAYGEVVAAHDQAVYESRLKWFKDLRQPLYGIRVGVAAVVDESLFKGKSVERGDTLALLREHTQDLGEKLVAGTQKLLDEGKLGQWPADHKVKGLTVLKSGEREAVLADARSQALDCVVAVEITDHGAKDGRSDVGFIVRVMDVSGTKRLWSSDSFYRNRVDGGQRGKGKTSAERLTETPEKYVGNFERKSAPAALPELTAEEVKARLKEIGKNPPTRAMPVLAELGWYQVRGWATSEELRPLYEQLLPPEAAEVMLTGDAAARREWVAKWLAENAP